MGISLHLDNHLKPRFRHQPFESRGNRAKTTILKPVEYVAFKYGPSSIGKKQYQGEMSVLRVPAGAMHGYRSCYSRRERKPLEEIDKFFHPPAAHKNRANMLTLIFLTFQ